MRIRKFEASTLQQAMARVKSELGEDAVILHTRSYPARLFGLLGKSRVEVTAAVEDQQPRFAPARTPQSEERPHTFRAPAIEPAPAMETVQTAALHSAANEFLSRMERLRQAESTAAFEEQPAAPRIIKAASPPALEPAPENKLLAPPAEQVRIEALEVRIDRLTNAMERLLSVSGPLGQVGMLADIPAPWHASMKRLMQSSLSESLLNRLAAKVKHIPYPGAVFESRILCDLISESIQTSPPITKPETGQRIISLVGPTGVGKTTTLAKLASGLVVNHSQPTRVGLITVDTYRLAAEDQLRKYADILRLDLHVVYGPEEMPDAIRRCHQADVIFIDTAGRSPRDERQMGELKAFLDQVPECEKFLVVSSTMSDRYVEEAVERFRPIEVDSLIVTKLDETQNYAAPFNIQYVTKIPVSYLTTGQNVPEDIEPFIPARVAEGILNNLAAAEEQAVEEEVSALAVKA